MIPNVFEGFKGVSDSIEDGSLVGRFVIFSFIILSRFLFIMIVHSLSAQNYIHQVLILNEGYFDYQANQIMDPVTIGSYNPNTQTYTTIDTINGARFASDIIVDESCFYIAADNTLYKYDKNTYNLIATQQIPGIRNLAIYQDKILISRGEYLTSYNSYLQIYSKIDLSCKYNLCKYSICH